MATKNYTLVVTGSTKGIGQAVCKAFAPVCETLFLHSRSEQDLNRQKEELQLINPELKVYFRAADFGRPEEVIAYADFIRSKAEWVDILVNNAGIFYPGSVVNEDEGNLRDMTQVNLFSAYDLTRKLLPLIRKSEQAHIFNMCSIASIMAYPNGGAYTITKFALLGMSKCLRAELIPEKIKVTAVMPGATWSQSWEGFDAPEDRLMQASDIALCILNAASLSPAACVEEILIRPVAGDL
jgi:short-subunit dehydrogenase